MLDFISRFAKLAFDPFGRYLNRNLPYLWRLHLFYPVLFFIFVVVGLYFWGAPNINTYSDVPAFIDLKGELTEIQSSWFVWLSILGVLWLLQIFKYPLINATPKVNTLTFLAALFASFLFFSSSFYYTHIHLTKIADLYSETKFAQDKNISKAMCTNSLAKQPTELKEGFSNRWLASRDSNKSDFSKISTLTFKIENKIFYFNKGVDGIPVLEVTKHIDLTPTPYRDRDRWSASDIALYFNLCHKSALKNKHYLQSIEDNAQFSVEYVGDTRFSYQPSLLSQRKIKSIEYAHAYQEAVAKNFFSAFIKYHPAPKLLLLVSILFGTIIFLISNRGFGTFSIFQEYISRQYLRFRSLFNLTRLEKYFSQNMPTMWAIGNHNIIPDVILGAVVGFAIPHIMPFISDSNDAQLYGLLFGGFVVLIVYSIYRCMRLMTYRIQLKSYFSTLTTLTSTLLFQLPFFISLTLVSQFSMSLSSNNDRDLEGWEGSILIGLILSFALLWAMLLMFLSSICKDRLALVIAIICLPVLFSIEFAADSNPSEQEVINLVVLSICLISGFVTIINQYHKWIAIFFLSLLNFSLLFLFADEGLFSVETIFELFFIESGDSFLRDNFSSDGQGALFLAASLFISVFIWLFVVPAPLRKIYLFEQIPRKS